MKVTLHRAISEQKILTDRIEKATNSAKFVLYKKVNDTTVNGLDLEKVKESLTSELTQIEDLYKRREAIALAISEANSIHKIKVKDKEYTIAQALALKNLIFIKKDLVRKLREKLVLNTTLVERLNAEAHKEAMAFAQKDTAAGKGELNAQLKAKYDVIYDSGKAELVDPNGVADLIKELEADIEFFEKEISFALVEKNATVTIEIAD